MTEVMIDIETFSCKPNAMIATIGAVKFQSSTGKIQEQYYEKIKINDKDIEFFHQSMDTLLWWKKQSKESNTDIFCKDGRIELKDALVKLCDFIPKEAKIWAKGPDFDCVILSTAFEYYGLEIPWFYWNKRDLRTLMDISNSKDADFQHLLVNRHNALQDCIHQVKIVKSCYDKILF